MSDPGRPLDQEARDTAVRWTGGPVLVEAGAGTGKTDLMVKRVVHLVRNEGVSLARVAAITFTLKAAAELRERLRKGLGDALREESEPGARARLAAAREEIDQAQISTIHSFALRLLRERALEAGLAPGAGEVDPLAHEELRGRLWAEWLADRFSRGDPALGEFLSLGLTLGHLAALRDALLELPELAEGFPRARSLSPAGIKEKVREAFGRWKDFADAECADRSDTAYAQVSAIGEWADSLPDASRPDLLRALWQPSARLNKRVGSPKKWKEERAGLKAFRDWYDVFLQEACAEAGHEVLAGAVASLRGFAERLEAAAAREGLLTYQDILHRAVRLVRGSAEARALFRRRFEHFLVDEFQDTDPLQVELVFLLASGDPCPADWREARLEGGRLFLVGDPKQAIYRFRRADIAVYEEAKEAVRRSPGGRVLAITENFRSAPGVIAFVNGVFGRLLGGGEFQAGYLPLEAARRDGGPRVLLLSGPEGGASPEEDAPPPGDNAEEERAGEEKAEARRLREAALLASALKRLKEEGAEIWDKRMKAHRPFAYGDAVLLLRARTGYGEYEEAFRAAGVPFLSEGGRGFFGRAEVAGAAAVLRAVLRPADPVALAAALRSPLYGFSDPELARWFLEGLEPSPELIAAVEEIRALHAARGSLSARALLEEIFRRTQAFELFLASFQGEQRAANLLKLLDLAFGHGGGGARGADEFGAFLDEQIARGEDAREPEAAALDAQAEAVRFMTIHAAKGLEFPVVALADLGGRVDWMSGPAIAERPEGRVHLRLGEKDRPLESLGYARAEEREKEFWRAEQMRLLYVAATRARDYLLLPLLPGKGGMWKLMAEGGVEVEAVRAGALGPVLPFEARPAEAAESESYFRLPPSAFEPGEEPIGEGLRKREELAARLDALKRPPAWKPPVAPSRLAEEAEPGGSLEEARYGGEGEGRAGSLAFGTLVHALLARLDSLPPDGLAAEARAQALAGGLGEAEAEEALALVRRAAAGPLLKRAAAAPRRWRELPFFAEVEGRLVRGFADLVFEEGEALVLCDFKTDAARPGEVPQRAGRYALQGAACAVCLELASGKEVREVVFSFLRPGADHAFAVDGAFRSLARGAVRGAG
ncbi:MAG: UvrD-helicase domain-containing protein [Nitrospinota bacterium]